MKTLPLADSIESGAVGQWMYEYAAEMFPICRSITGDGLRQTLEIIDREIPLTRTAIETGTPEFDWTVPEEWNVRDAYVRDMHGKRVVDFRASNLHVLGYSEPVHRTMPLDELRKHCFTLPNQPDLIPYRTSYYARTWGFCVAHNVLSALPDGDYEVCIDSTLAPGRLEFGEHVIAGSSADEFVISAHICHPSLANDNLSGIAVATALARLLKNRELRYTYRFIFAPGTIGAIAWLAQNEERLNHFHFGVSLACVGDSQPLTFKKSRRGDTELDQTVQYVLESSNAPHRIVPFTPYGYDERQYCSPGFNLPFGCIMRGGPAGYPEYHTSADNLDLIRPEYLEDTLRQLAAIVETVEQNGVYRNMNPKCEPQLGRRGLYASIGGVKEKRDVEMAMLWVLNYSDGCHSLIDIARQSGYRFGTVSRAAQLLLSAGLLGL